MVALVPAAGVAGAATNVASPAAGHSKPLWQAARDYYFNPVSPANPRAMPDLKASELKAYERRSAEAAKARLGYPPAAQALARREALALKSGLSPMAVAK